MNIYLGQRIIHVDAVCPALQSFFLELPLLSGAALGMETVGGRGEGEGEEGISKKKPASPVVSTPLPLSIALKH
jgi:hypothetical protein